VQQVLQSRSVIKICGTIYYGARRTLDSHPIRILRSFHLRGGPALASRQGTVKPKGQSGMGGFNYWAFFLLGVDSLIACIVTGPMFIKQRQDGRGVEHRVPVRAGASTVGGDPADELRPPDGRKHASQWKWWAIGGVSALAVPYGLSYGIGDGFGYLIGTAFHLSISDTLSSVLETTLLVALGFYWIGIYFAARKMQTSERLQKWSWRGIWILPVALSIDNLTYGAVTGVPAHASVWASAGLQALASGALGLIGLAVGVGLAVLIPSLRTRMYRTFGVVGVGVLATAVLLGVTGW
jgi:putative Mn2+ efflux pump MntP